MGRLGIQQDDDLLSSVKEFRAILKQVNAEAEREVSETLATQLNLWVPPFLQLQSKNIYPTALLERSDEHVSV